MYTSVQFIRVYDRAIAIGAGAELQLSCAVHGLRFPPSIGFILFRFVPRPCSRNQHSPSFFFLSLFLPFFLLLVLSSHVHVWFMFIRAVSRWLHFIRKDRFVGPRRRLDTLLTWRWLDSFRVRPMAGNRRCLAPPARPLHSSQLTRTWTTAHIIASHRPTRVGDATQRHNHPIVYEHHLIAS